MKNAIDFRMNRLTLFKLARKKTNLQSSEKIIKKEML